MARIRTIKPEFWTDEKVVQLSFPARLLFVGLWNFCDDEGFLWDEPLRIKLQILPNDDVDISVLVDELVGAGVVARHRSDNDRSALQVVNFEAHQRVSHPSPSRIAPELSGVLQSPPEDSRVLPPERNLTERKGKELTTESTSCETCGDQNWECTRCAHRRERAETRKGLDEVKSSLSERGFGANDIEYGLKAVESARASGKTIAQPERYAVGAINKRKAS